MIKAKPPRTTKEVEAEKPKEVKLKAVKPPRPATQKDKKDLQPVERKQVAIPNTASSQVIDPSNLLDDTDMDEVTKKIADNILKELSDTYVTKDEVGKIVIAVLEKIAAQNATTSASDLVPKKKSIIKRIFKKK